MVKKRYHAIVTGLVQGVFFRMFAKRTARSLGLKGYTKNLPDKTVEVVVEGEEKNIKVILDWLKKGPSAAKVVDIKIKKQEYKGEFDSFEIIT
ncbi:MAG: acylphosphatase [Candidatus Aenigmarchaeota archaeon]|nr:acylphosphatase [Candidatus Aenigmarchaeota archaeon]